MRGPSPRQRRNNAQLKTRNPATSIPATVPAPYGGWNARGSLVNMSPIEALVLDNFFPGIQNVTLRSGSSSHTTGFASAVKTLAVYEGANATAAMFAATDSGFYAASAAGAVGASVTSCTEGRWKFINFANAGGYYLIGVNGVDDMKNYDGTTWTDIDTTSTPAITGVATADCIDIALHKNRIWLVEEASMSLWYLPVNAIAGAATEFPVGGLFRKGGQVVAIGSWTLDAGNGIDDFFIIVTSKGEIAVYQGTDPASANTWALVGVYEAANPLGDRPLIKYGGDLLYLGYNGLFPLSKFLQTSVLKEDDAVSYLIDGAFIEAADTYRGNVGWDMLLFPLGNMLIVNIPVAIGSSYQFAMNTTTKRWCRFTGWDSYCWAVFNDEIYFGAADRVVKAWSGTSDEGSPIIGTSAQAYNNFGVESQKLINLVRPNIGVSGVGTMTLSIDTDFKEFEGSTTLNFNPSSGSSVWDTALWDTGTWTSTQVPIEPRWLTVPSEPGYLLSFRLQFTSSSSSLSWNATNFALTPNLGIL